MDSEIINKVQEKLKFMSISGIERRFGFPRNTLHNTLNIGRALPKRHKVVLVNFLTDDVDEKKQNWDISKTKIRKGIYPKWLVRLRDYCKQHNITTDDLIKMHERMHG